VFVVLGCNSKKETETPPAKEIETPPARKIEKILKKEIEKIPKNVFENFPEQSTTLSCNQMAPIIKKCFDQNKKIEAVVKECEEE
jgi:hypothetical protein